MHIAAHFRRVNLSPLILVALILLAAPCLAVTMRVNVGFDGVQQMNSWTPIAVSLVNASSENVEGVLVVNEPEGSQAPMPLCTTAVNLPAHSTKLYHAYARFPGYGGKIRISLNRGYGVLASREVNVNPVAREDRLIVSIGERTGRLGFLQGEQIAVQVRDPYGSGTTSQPVAIQAGSLSPDMLPDRPAAYESADVIVISGLAPDSTNPNALKAICAWVASGGTLVVSTGPDYRAYMNPFYDELLPVKIEGAANLPGMAGLGSLGGAAFPAGPAAVAKSTVKAGVGTVLLSESGVPLIVERQYGAGKVLFLAFDHKSSPFRDWNGQTAFWKSIVKGANGEPIAPTESSLPGEGMASRYSRGYNPGEQMGGLAGTVMQNPSIKTPSLSVIALFLLAYLVILVPANYIVLRAKRRLELAWLTTPAIVLLFTLGAYAIGYTMKGGNLRLCEAVVVEGSSNARYARTVADASVFSPARRSYDIAIADPSAISQMIALGRDDEPPVTLLGETSAMQGVGMAMWSSKTFEAVGGTDLGGVMEANLQQVGGQVRGEIRNNTGVDLKDCVVICGGASTEIGRLNKGESVPMQVDIRPGTGHAPFYPSSESSLNQRLRPFVCNKAASTGTPVLVGFADSRTGVIDISSNRAATERSVCYVFHLDCPGIQGLAAHAAPAAPAPIVTSPIQVQGDTILSEYVGDTVTRRYKLPVPPGSPVIAIKIGTPTGARGSANGLTIKAYNVSTRQWVSVAPGSTLPNPGRYVSPDDTVALKITNPGGNSRKINCDIWATSRLP